jgi:carbon monoxide dehydrogenase subunit G
MTRMTEERRSTMTEVFAVKTMIDRPIDAVWSRLVDWETAAGWMSGVDALRAKGPTEVGTELVFTARGKERTGHVAALTQGRSITLRSTQCGVTADYMYACAPQGERTSVSLVADYRMTGPLRLLGPVIRSTVRRADGGQLDAFAATFATP